MRAGPILETVLYADDLPAVKKFYGEVLGLPIYREQDERFVFFWCGQQMLLLFNPDATDKQNVADGPPPHGTRGNGHVCFRATRVELDLWQEHFGKCHVAIEKVMDWPSGGKSVYVRDPAGNSVEFAEALIWELPEFRSLHNQTIVIATHNKGKLEEFREILSPHGISVVSAGELKLAEPQETETTFAGNARIKALAAVRASGLIAIADDSGLCVDALDGAPGVYTADWAGPDRDWIMAMRTVEEKLQAVGAITPAQRKATFNCTLCVIWPDGQERFYVGQVPGHLAWPPRGTLGHGYDPMFVPEGETQTFGEMTHAKKNTLSHRARAIEKLARDLL